MAARRLLLLVASCLFPATALGQLYSYDFSLVTQLANGALAGQNVRTAIPGFELLLRHEGEIVYQQAFGDWQVGRVADLDSATKPLSGAVIMSLTDSSAEPFSLDTKLSQYIPQFSGRKTDVTIRDAFAHLSGFAESDALDLRDITLYEAALDIADDPLWAPPGKVFLYGGTSMQAAGAVAEIAGGDSWRNLFDTRIVDKMGLANTQFPYMSQSNPRIGGGARSNAEDYSAFMEMLRNDGMHNGTRVLSAQAVDEMLTRQTPLGVPAPCSPVDGSADHGVGIWLDQRDAAGNLTGALAGGLRGFTSWIDFDDEMVGTLATDMSYFDENIEDFQYLIRAAAEQAVRVPLLVGDTDGDGQVLFGDFQTLAANLGAAGSWSDGDFNGDGVVDMQDVELAELNYSPLTADVDWARAVAAVPEPSTLVMACTAAIALAGWRIGRRR